MNHPKPEEWPPYVFREATAETRRKLDAHLKSCPECAARIDAWNRSLRRLDGWKLPGPRRAPFARVPAVLKWGIAAALVLAAGFGLGRIAGTARGDRAALPPAVDAALRAALAADIRAAVDAARRETAAEWQDRFDRALRDFAAGSAAENRRQLEGVLSAIQDARAEDRRAFLAVFDRIQKERAADLLALRSDLETVAVSADEEIRRARLGLAQLAAGRPGTVVQP